MNTAELKNQTLVAAAAAKDKGFENTYQALIGIVRELECCELAQGYGPTYRSIAEIREKNRLNLN